MQREMQSLTKKCNCDEYEETCSAEYTCVKVKGQVDYGGEVMSNASNPVTFYDSRGNLNSEVSNVEGTCGRMLYTVVRMIWER